ncbi:tRNA (guanosine(46)-N7)-methyltransferase TrmB [bacterium]|nr:tRNA (guanosine(46)-N7)-methyltransferase TrmB [bacterium]
MEKQEIRTFGRRHGKKLSARQDHLIRDLLPRIAPGNAADILEIGFGAGEHVRELALHHPDKIIIGAEPFMNGVASLLSAITDAATDTVRDEYKNIRIYPDDVRLLLKNHTYQFDQIWILHPDPWPKARHEKRRLLQAEFIQMLSVHLAPRGRIIIGTDHWDYFDWIVDQIKNTSMRMESADFETIQTRYCRKNMAGTPAVKYLILSRDS